MDLLRPKKSTRQIMINAFQYCHTDETFVNQTKIEDEYKGECTAIALHHQKELSRPDVPRTYSDIC